MRSITMMRCHHKNGTSFYSWNRSKVQQLCECMANRLSTHRSRRRESHCPGRSWCGIKIYLARGTPKSGYWTRKEGIKINKKQWAKIWFMFDAWFIVTVNGQAVKEQLIAVSCHNFMIVLVRSIVFRIHSCWNECWSKPGWEWMPEISILFGNEKTLRTKPSRSHTHTFHYFESFTQLNKKINC